MNNLYYFNLFSLRSRLSLKENDSFLLLKELIKVSNINSLIYTILLISIFDNLKNTANDKDFNFRCAKELNLILESIEIILQTQISNINFEILKLLSELSILIGVVRNISTLSLDYRRIISNSKIFATLDMLIYSNVNNKEKLGFLNLIAFELLKFDKISFGKNHFFVEYYNEFLLLQNRILQLLANVVIDSSVEYQVSLFRFESKNNKQFNLELYF